MKVVLLASANSIHAIRWANGLVTRDVEVHLISVHDLLGEFLDELDSRVTFHLLPFKTPWSYLTATPFLKKKLEIIKPNLLNAHFATGYGLLARLSGFKPLLLSVWGSDIYDFPQKSPIHRWLLCNNLKSASAIASTSKCMLRKVFEIYKHPKAFITSFGIDEKRFLSLGSCKEDKKSVVLGTVKTLKPQYGIDTLIESFAITVKKLGNNYSLSLEISGDGPDLVQLENLANELGIRDQVIFYGNVAHDKVPYMLNKLDIFVALSRKESFGVAILEASACGKPVVVSDADGPAEVTLDGKTGFIVPKNNPEAASKAMIQLIEDVNLRRQMGEQGIAHVLKHYTWTKSLDFMLKAYQQTIDSYK